MTKNFLFKLLITLIILFFSITVYMVTVDIDDRDSDNTSIRYGGNNPHKTEFVQNVTLDRIEGNKAYFKEDIPEYLPGITSHNSVDMNFYKSSRFKENSKLKIIRIYSEDDKGDPIHIYSFKKRSEKVR